MAGSSSLAGWRLRVLVAAVLLAGVCCAAAAAAAAAADAGVPAAWRLALVCLVLVAGDLAVLRMRFGRDSYMFTWSEASIILGLVLVPGPWLVLLGGLGIAAAELLARRDPVKVAFNAASVGVGATLAWGISTAVAGPGLSVQSPRTWAALALGAAAHFVWNNASVSAAIALSTGRRYRDVVRTGVLLKLVVLVGNTVAALLLVTAQWQGSTVVLLPFTVVLLYASYRGYVRALDERDVWQELEGVSGAVNRLDEQELAADAVLRARRLFGADRVELALIDPSSTVTSRTCAGPAGPAVAVPVPSGQPGLPDAALLPPTDSGRWLSAPLAGIAGTIGVLHLELPPGSGLDDRRQRVLGTFLHGLGTGLQNARLYEETRLAAERSAFEAGHDPLTGLANRKLLQERAAEVLAEGGTTGLLLVDLDHFKEVNDTLGHGAGDELLRTLAGRLVPAVRSTDLVARLGGDEFAILLPGLGCPAEADGVARELLEVLRQPVTHERMRLVVEGSIGVACSPHDAEDIHGLLRAADVALYEAKETRASVVHYSSDRDYSSVRRLALHAELRAAIEAGQLVPHFQPQVDLRTGRIVGAEALARWEHPERGTLPPAEFVGVAEQTGLMREFTLALLDRSVAECCRWRDAGTPVPVSVNLSARNLLDRQLPEDVARVLARHGLDPGDLVLEITETTMMSELEVVEEVLGAVRRLGVALSVDDFGTGYSSLALLQRIAVHEIKVDRSFVRQMTEQESDAAIVRATVDLAHSLGLRVVAEGVETEQHVAALQSLRCDVGQGWHFARPQDPVGMRRLLETTRGWVEGFAPPLVA